MIGDEVGSITREERTEMNRARGVVSENKCKQSCAGAEVSRVGDE